MKISSIEVIRIGEPKWDDLPWWSTSPLDVFLIEGSTPAQRQSGLYNKAPGTGDNVFALIVRISLENGMTGIGCIALGSEATAVFIERNLSPLVLGSSVFDTEMIWNKMFRGTINVGRRGLVLNAISGIDIAIWDALGHLLQQPVYNLLGGKTKKRIRPYLSSGYTMEDPDRMVDLAARYVSEGYTAFKMRFGYGPADGRPGMLKNKEIIRKLRLKLGDKMEIMGDAYMGWTRQYAIEMIRMIDEYELTWIEEPLLPDDVEGYAQIRSSCRTAVAGGEHEATRWGFRRLITAGAVDYVQLDVNRVGGITEARKICALAASFDLPVVPHSPNFHNAHLIMANFNAPLIEMFPRDYRDGDTFIAELFRGDPASREGYVYLDDNPGFGVTLDDDVVERFRVGGDTV
jgi:L-rhamnonate dehydratase